MGKITPLYEEHKKLGARIIDFSGWLMPVFYSSVIEEHKNVRKNAGIFDICHMGEIFIEGENAFDLIQKLITNDLEKLEDNKTFYSAMCLENGGVIDDLMVYRFNKNKFMVVVNAVNVEKDIEWFEKHNDFNASIINKTDKTAKIDLQGPKSEEILQKLTDANLKELKRFSFIEEKINSTPTIISRTGYTGEDGFELYFSAEKAVGIWNKLLEVGKAVNLKPIGLGARDTLRIEAGYSLYGHELSEEINPFEAGIGFVVKFDKEFIGKEALLKAKETVRRKIVAFQLERGIPRQDYLVFRGNEIGYVTSGTLSPTFKKGIGMALINTEDAVIENEIHIKIREKLYRGKIIKKPIYAFKGEKT